MTSLKRMNQLVQECAEYEAPEDKRARLTANMPIPVTQLAQSYLDREDEDWTWVDPEDIKRLARAVLDYDD